MIYKFKEYEKQEVIKNHLNLGGTSPDGGSIEVTSKYFMRDGKPWIGVMGEFHFSRYSRDKWKQELCKMKAGGINIISTYLFWIYHEEEEGIFDFEGDNDIRAFVMECRELGLDTVIRIGPWAHGECRNGGFPDWLLKKPFKLRDNNEEYLQKVKIWYKKIAEQLEGLFYGNGGNIIGVQIENELVDNAEHLLKLKETAAECGIIAPIYTVTGWNSAAGAKIPVNEVVPVFGGYCEAPWENHIKRLEPSPHYFFNRMRNDAAIGTDLIARKELDGWQLPYEKYPFATCELGGGIQITHHRRPIIKGMDIYALSLVKLGDGNNLIGYYMYHGGINKIGKKSTLNESKATGYPNDYPILSYDFQAPISGYGEIREQYGLLNLLHLFVQDFGDRLAVMDAVDAEQCVKRDDTKSLRYGMRTDGKSGFVFVNHYQRLTELEDVRNVVIDTGETVFPAIDVKGDISFFMPFNMELSGLVMEYAAAQPICREQNTYFFAEIPGIEPVYRMKNGKEYKAKRGEISKFDMEEVSVVTVPFEKARYLRRLGSRIYIGDKCSLYEENGSILSAEDGDYGFWVWRDSGFEYCKVKREYIKPEVILKDIDEPPFKAEYIELMHIGGQRKISWKKVSVSGRSGFIEIEYEGDGAQLYADGKLAADDFYCGKPWRLPADMLYGKECYMAVSELRDDFYKEF